MIRFLNICFFSFILINSVRSQPNVNYYSFNKLYGLDENTIYDIHQGKDRVYTFATASGLYRFDGTQIINYTYPGYDTEYSALQEDIEGRIWFMSFRGQLFYFQDDSVHLFMDKSEDIEELFEYSLADYPNIKVKLKNNVSFYNAHTKDLVKKEQKTIYTLNVNGDELIGEGNRLYLKTDSSRYLINKKKRCYSLEIKDTRYLFNLYSDSLVIENIEHNISLFKTRYINDGSWNGVSIISDTLIVFCTKKGFVKYNPSTNKIQNNFWLKSFSISKYFVDDENNVFLATLNKGVIVLPAQEFLVYRLCDNEEWVSDIKHDNKKLFYFLTNTDKLKVYNPESNTIELIGDFKFNFGIAINKKGIFGIKVVYKNQKLNKKERFYFKKSLEQEKYNFYTGSYLLLDNKNKSELPWEYKTKCSKKGTMSIFEEPIILYPQKKCKEIAQDKQGNVYVDYSSGVYVFPTDSSQYPATYNSENIIASAFSKNNTSGVWLTDKNKRLFRILGNKIKFKHKFDQQIGSMALWKNYLFLSTGNYILKLDTNNFIENKIDFTDGLMESPIKEIYVRQDTLYVFSEKSIQKIPCSYSYVNSVKPSIRIAKVLLFDKEITRKKNLRLSHNQNYLSFRLKANSIRSQKSFVYKYRMKGFSNKWNIISSENPEIQYPNIAPGSYVFEAKVCNEDDVCSGIERIKIFIDKPFYNKWWFYLLFFLFLGVIVQYSYRRRIKAIGIKQSYEKDKESLQKEIYQSKIAAIRAQMNPHFMFNALNTIQDFIVSNKKEIASEYLADFADLMRCYLDQSKHEYISIIEELETLEIYLKLESLRFNNELQYKIHVDEKMNLQMEIPVMLLQPFVENAIKHGLLHKTGQKRLSISFFQKKDGISIEVLDNGIGRAASEKINKTKVKMHKSFATSAIEKRIELIQKNYKENIQVSTKDITENNLPNGTIVIINISN